MVLREADFEHLRRCVELARMALDNGSAPFGSAHAWAGLGRVVYATSGAQLWQWLADWDAPIPPVAPLPITTVAPRAVVDGPVPEFEGELKSLYEARFKS